MQIRSQQPDEDAAIADVITAAFATAAHRNGQEAAIVTALRATQALTLSLVADSGAGIVGHIALSPVQIDDGSTQWHGLGPVAVAPSWQGQQIGTRLVNAALDQLRRDGAHGCVVLGDPAWYQRFGFTRIDGLVFPAAPAPYFMGLAFTAHRPRGVVHYHRAFSPE